MYFKNSDFLINSPEKCYFQFFVVLNTKTTWTLFFCLKSKTKPSLTFIEILWFVRKPYIVRNGLTAFQNFLLLAKPILITLWKKFFFIVLVRLLQKFFTLFTAKKFSLNGHFMYLFRVSDLFITVLLNSLVIKGL